MLDTKGPEYRIKTFRDGKVFLKEGEMFTLCVNDVIGDETRVSVNYAGLAEDLEPGDKVFPYIQENVDEIITIEDDELIVAFLDMVENHKMIVENSGLLSVAALSHLDVKDKKVVCVLSGGNMDVITMSSVVSHGLIQRDRIFTISVLLPDRPGELVRVAQTVADAKGNVIRLDHNQFVSTNRNAAVELRVTIEAFGTAHKQAIIDALTNIGLTPEIILTQL
jgi:threonine dehydratase